MFMTVWIFEARHCATLPYEIKKTKLQIYTEPQAGINILLGAGRFCPTAIYIEFVHTLEVEFVQRVRVDLGVKVKRNSPEEMCLFSNCLRSNILSGV